MASCAREDAAEWVDLAGDSPNRLVVLFHEEVDPSDVYAFLQQHIYMPAPDGGFKHRPEIDAVLKVRIQNYDAYEIGLNPELSADQIADIREKMTNSDLVYRIYENVRPDQIKLEEVSDASPAGKT